MVRFIGLDLQHMDNKSLKENIYKRRKELGLSQECVAEQVDISLNAYIKIEKGPTKIFNPKIVKIAEALDTTPEPLSSALLSEWTSMLKFVKISSSITTPE